MSAKNVFHGATTREAAVMDLWDAGMGSHAITAKLNIRHAIVMDIIGRFSVQTEDRWVADARRGSAALLAAIHRVQAGAVA